ncbi:MAG: hypothetical protein HRT65_07985 [Flavobacteriaceae bacterium]|nr:hypothetical protein [Flavobacteriaceae bacterium]
MRKKLLRKKNKPKQVESKTEVLLIEGTFLPAEAADILLSLLNDKIKFHTVRLLNHQDTDYEDPLGSASRLEALRESKKSITELVVRAKNKGERLKIHSTITIESLP